MTKHSPPDELIELSHRLGGDPALVQDAGGNTSVKVGTTLWVKASGALLSDVSQQSGFVGVDLDVLADLRVRKQWEDITPAVTTAAEGSRPSIETWLHALLPHRVVAHVHSTAAVAASLGPDPEQVLRAALEPAGLSFATVPYRRPGSPLAEAVDRAVGAAVPDVVLLGNHGLVVGADEAAGAADVVERVHGLLDEALPPSTFIDPADRHASQPGLAPDGYSWSTDAEHHWLAGPHAVRAIRAGAWSPDQVVFLGPSWQLADAAGPRADSEQPVIVVEGEGVLLRDGMRRSALALLDFLVDVSRRLAATPVSVLTAQQERELLGWDAEHHRQAAADVRAGR